MSTPVYHGSEAAKLMTAVVGSRNIEASVLATLVVISACGPMSLPTTPTATAARIDTNDRRIVQRLPVDVPGQEPWRAVEIDPYVYVVTHGIQTGDGAVVHIDSRTAGAAGRVLRLDFAPGEVAYGFGSLWVAHARGDAPIVRIDLATLRVTASVQGAHFMGPGVTTALGFVWSANLDPYAPPGPGSGSVSRIDPATNAITLTIPSGPSPLAIAAGEHQLWTANHGNETISWIDVDRTVVTTETASEGIHNVIWGGGYVWAASYHTHAILRIDPGTRKTIDRTALPFAPLALAILRDRLYVASAGIGVGTETHGRIAAIRLADASVEEILDIGPRIAGLTVAGDRLLAICGAPAIIVEVRL